MISQARLKELMHYDPETGVFARLATHRGPTGTRAPSNRGYLRIMLDGRRYQLHRLAFLYMTGEWPQDQVDHINRDRADNRWSNLRDVSNKENCKNQGVRKANTSGVTGVSFHEGTQQWRVQIGTEHIGYSREFADAVALRQAAEEERGYV